MDFGDTLQPVARKDHKCHWCAQQIPKGEKHMQFKGKWEGEWQNWRMHSECWLYANDNCYLQEGFTPYCYERPS